MNITMVKAARCFAVRETTPLATSRAESAERSSVIRDGKANTAQSVSSLATITKSTYLSRENSSNILRKIIDLCAEVLLATRT